jgi:hypothetical protein
MGDEAGRMLLHQAVQRGLLGPVSRVTDRAVFGFAKSRQRESGHVAASIYCRYIEYFGLAKTPAIAPPAIAPPPPVARHSCEMKGPLLPLDHQQAF